MVCTDSQLIDVVNYDCVSFPKQLFILSIVNRCICSVFYRFFGNYSLAPH